MIDLANPRRLHLLLATSVALWYAASTYLPVLLGSCLARVCDPSPARIAISLLIPLLLAGFPVLIEVVGFGLGWSEALKKIGVTRWSGKGFGVAWLYLLPLALFYPIFALATGQTLSIQPSWLGRAAGAVLNNGLNEEVMMRGFVFRRLRERRPFWRAAALSTAYFSAYHVPMIFREGPLIGTIGLLISVPIGLLLAYVYERGDRTIWGCALVHAGTNGMAFLFAVGPALQPVATSLYLLTSILASTAILLVARRDRRIRQAPAPA